MRKFAVIFALASCNQRAAGPRTAWAADEASAFARAKAEHKGVIAEAYASWAMQSIELDKELHGAALDGWIAYRRDVSNGTDDDARWQDQHGAQILPWIGLYDADGRELARVDRSISPADLAALIARTGTPSSR